MDDRWGAKAPLCADQRIQIPNTIRALWLGEGGAVGKKIVSWNADIAYLRERGFNVDESDGKGLGGAFVNYMHENTKNGILHGLFVTGHGSRVSFSEKGGGADPSKQFYVEYNDFIPKMKYRLGLGILNVCYGGFRQGEDYQRVGGFGGRDIVSNSPAARFYGVKITLVPPLDTGHPKDILKPGEQRTKP